MVFAALKSLNGFLVAL